MSEDNTQGEQTNSQALPAQTGEQSSPQVAAKASDVPQLNQDDIVNKVLNQLKPTLDGLKPVSSDEISNRVNTTIRQDLIKVLGGATEVDDSEELLAEIVNDPKGFKQKIISETLKEVSERETLIRQKQDEVKNAFDEVMSHRTDIRQSKQARALVLGFYNATDSRMKEVDRQKAAVEAYDAFLEQQGLGTSQERLAKISSVSGSASTQSPKEKQVTQAEADQEYLKSRKERASRLRGNR